MFFRRKKKEQCEHVPLQGKIVVEIEHYHNPQHKTYHKIDADQDVVTVGRGYENDIIIHDPFMSVLHVHLSQQEDQTWLVIDQKSENGTTQNGVHTHTEIPLRSGDVITIGRTKLRFYDEQHPVKRTLRLAKPNSLRSKLERPTTNTILTILAFLAVLGMSYFEEWKQDMASHLVSTSAAVAIIIGIWSAIWAVVSRISTHRAHFSSHAGIFCIFVILQWAIYYIGSYVDFFFHENLFANIVEAFMQIVAIAFLLFGALSFATNMPKKKRIFQSVLNAHLLIIGTVSISIIQAYQFDDAPHYATSLRPYLTDLVSTKDIDHYMDKTEDLFGNSTFEQVKDTVEEILKAKEKEKHFSEDLGLPPMPQ